jgi:hypothetical protein
MLPRSSWASAARTHTHTHTHTHNTHTHISRQRPQAENTWCTTCPDSRQCVFPTCCSRHSCTAKSAESRSISTHPPKMSTPRILSATTFSILVTWDLLPGTTDNIFRYELQYRDIDRGTKEDTGAWNTLTLPGAGTSFFQLLGLDSNNRSAHDSKPNASSFTSCWRLHTNSSD